MRINGHIETAIFAMWMRRPRAAVVLGMVTASIRGEGPEREDGEFFVKLRALIDEARGYYDEGEFPAAMARMYVAQDLVELRIIKLDEE